MGARPKGQAAKIDTGHLNRNLDAVAAHHHVRTAFTEALAVQGTLVMFNHDVPSIYHLYLRDIDERGLQVCHEASGGTPLAMVKHFHAEARQLEDARKMANHRHHVYVPAVLELLRQAADWHENRLTRKYRGAVEALAEVTQYVQSTGQPTAQLPAPKRRKGFSAGAEAAAYSSY